MKIGKKLLALCLALALVLSLAACGGKAENSETTMPSSEAAQDSGERNWVGFHGWQEEPWDTKDIAYQFTGYWDMGDAEYGIAFSFLMNLYADGSVQAAQYQAGRSDYRYYGRWELVADPDGDQLNITIAEETDESGKLIPHKYSYEVYQENDGGFSFGFDFGIAAGQYFRVANMTGSSNVAYATVDEFKTAADAGAFVVAAPEEETEANDAEETTGYSCQVMLGDQEMTATLTLDDDTHATFVASVTFTCTYTKNGSVVTLEAPEELEGYQAQIWPNVSHSYVVNDEDMTMKAAAAVYNADPLLLVTFDDGTMRVEFPQYSMARDGFTYTLNEDGTVLTVTGTPDAEAMGGFQQIWDGVGGETWNLDGETATKAE